MNEKKENTTPSAIMSDSQTVSILIEIGQKSQN